MNSNNAQRDYKQNKSFRGIIRLYIGPMFSGKTSALIEAYTRHSIGQRNCLLVKHTSDTRYIEKDVSTHDGRHFVSSAMCSSLYEIDDIVDKYNVVCIDEIQFFEDAPIFCDKWANQGIIVEASGLCGTYTRSEFPVISKLIPLAEEVYKKAAVCRETGRDAQFTYRTSTEKATIVIGGSDKYKPVDRQTFFEDKDKLNEYNKESFTQFAEYFIKRNNVIISDDTKKRMIDSFNNSDEPIKDFVKFIVSFTENENKQKS